LISACAAVVANRMAAMAIVARLNVCMASPPSMEDRRHSREAVRKYDAPMRSNAGPKIILSL
jgi:hypothetical protein